MYPLGFALPLVSLLPTPVAIKTVPTLLFSEPISVKSVGVVPASVIIYLVPITNTPALTLAVAPALALILKSLINCPVGLPPGPASSSALPAPLVLVSNSHPLFILTMLLELLV